MRRQAQDDLAKWEMNAAGDPETQADSRSRAHEFAKILKASTPLVWPGCRITKSYEDGSRERPFVPCPHCDHMQVLEWENLQASIDADADRPHFLCTSGNGCALEEHDLRWMKQRLEWRADNPKAKPYHRSFWIWSAYSALQSWTRIAREWLAAKGDPGKEKAFFNDTLGLAYRAAGESVPWETLAARAEESDYPRGSIPPGGLLLTVGIDCQIDRTEHQVVAWGQDYRRWVVDYGVFPGHINETRTQELLDGLLKQTWTNSAGNSIGIDLAAIDGNAWTEDVWDWAKKHPASKLLMLRGRGEDTAPLLARVKRERSRQGKVLRYQRRFYNFATSVLKMGLYRNLEKTDPLERGFIGFPRGLEDEYYRQLTAERRQPVKRKDGFVSYQWVKDPGQANEGLDTHLQAEAAAIRLGVRHLPDATWAKYQQARCTAPAAAETPPAPGVPPATSEGTEPAPEPVPRPRTRLAM
jgi:phage terminase large subunit GpA-like protein